MTDLPRRPDPRRRAAHDQDPPADEAQRWWREGVFYQIYPRSFMDSDGDGIGDLRGITSRLGHLNDGSPDSLGIDAIWLSPFYRSPMADFGYDVADYRDVDPSFGTLADFDELLGQAHERGIRVIVDLVPNHTSDQHPWFVEARASRTSPKRDWYVWADAKPDGSPPNGWRSVFKQVGPAWTWDEATGQYYLNMFLPQQPDLNWWNPKVREAMDDVMRFWLDRGADGFRIDVASAMLHDPKLRDDLPTDRQQRRWPRLWGLRDVHEIHRHWRRLLDSYGDRVAVGEVSEDPAPGLLKWYGNGDELHLSFYFYFVQQPWSASAFRNAATTFDRGLPRGSWPNYTLSNHDRSRHATRYGPDHVRLAAMMLLTLRGTPFLYYGEEIGMTDVPIAPERIVDVDGRDPARTPMQWQAGPGAGFTIGDPWLPIAPDSDRVNVDAQRSDPQSVFSFYRRLVWYRRRSPALRRGSYHPIPTRSNIFAFLRVAGEERLLVALNFSADELTLRSGAIPPSGTVELSTDAGRSSGAVSLEPLVLAPNEGVLIRLGRRSKRD